MRCNICDKTEFKLSLFHESIPTSGHRPTFYQDPSGNGHICDECADDFFELMGDYHQDDEVDGKDMV